MQAIDITLQDSSVCACALEDASLRGSLTVPIHLAVSISSSGSDSASPYQISLPRSSVLQPVMNPRSNYLRQPHRGSGLSAVSQEGLLLWPRGPFPIFQPYEPLRDDTSAISTMLPVSFRDVFSLLHARLSGSDFQDTSLRFQRSYGRETRQCVLLSSSEWREDRGSCIERNVGADFDVRA